MATRIQKTRECDAGLCRRRKGVKMVRVLVELANAEGRYERAIGYEGELCPTHAQIIIEQPRRVFTNKKEYPDQIATEPEATE
tara:strand:- start:239 stop:487 length:249 start_codon:yes stop_codon:yes gene_type:complete